MNSIPCYSCGEPVVYQNVKAFGIASTRKHLVYCGDCRLPLPPMPKTREWVFYKNYLKSPEWKALAARRKKIDGYKCRLCYSPERPEVHHRTYDRKYHEDIEDLTTLCHDCHEWYELWKKSRENGRQLIGFAPVELKL